MSLCCDRNMNDVISIREMPGEYIYIYIYIYSIKRAAVTNLKLYFLKRLKKAEFSVAPAVFIRVSQPG